ncbi:hypothetical protein ABH924_004344 [Arthrobacter sp. GAS37]|uniref:hypothetical protein n=1 Tax=Arthrobacter sp. GAS37 TaxID=3156261 RepID=UPI00383434FE
MTETTTPDDGGTRATAPGPSWAHRHRRWLIPASAALVAAVAASVVTGMVLGPGANTPGALVPAAGSSSRVAASATPSADASRVGLLEAGSGGKTVSADGVTRIGYEATCTGAVQAAANYETTVDVYRPATDKAYTATLTEVFLDPGQAQNFGQVSARNATASGTTPGHRRDNFVDEGGAFKVESCNPGTSAIIQVYSCEVTYREDFYARKVSGIPACSTYRIQLGWARGDWKIVSLIDVYSVSTDAGIPLTLTGYPRRFYDVRSPGITAAQWADITAPDSAGPILGWVDFANAHR